MRKKNFVLFHLFVLVVWPGVMALSAQTNTSVPVRVEVHHVSVGGGTVHIGVFGKTAFKTDTPDEEFRLESTASVISADLPLPPGEYVMVVYQDTNGNDELDSGLFGFPKEPFGISNWNGGLPGSFDKRKVIVDGAMTEPLRINLRNVK
jgi:uncharacterized protein (DUF2141 family)